MSIGESIRGAVDNALERVDSWFNSVTGVGLGYGRTRFQHLEDVIFDDASLERLFTYDAYAARICTCVPEEALRRGFMLSTGDAALDQRTIEYWDSLHLTSKHVEAWTWGRVFGGGALLIGANDGNETWRPLDMRTLESIDYVVALDKRELQPMAWFDDPDGKNFGEPALYLLQRNGGTRQDTRPVHASRIIRFEGAMTNRWRKRANNSWSESELQRTFSNLQQFNGAFAAVATLLQDASQGVFSIKDLYTMMAADKSDKLKKRLQLMEETRSAARSIMIDKEKEEYKRVDVSGLTGGLPATLDKFMLYLAGAAQIPVTVLMGQSPAGLNATGDADIRWWYDRVASQREQTLRPRMQRLLRLIYAARTGPSGGQQPAKIELLFPSMYAPTPKEEADTRNAQAQADCAYVAAGVLDPNEVATSRMGRPNGYATEIVLDPTVKRVRQAPAGAPSGPMAAHDSKVPNDFSSAMPIIDKVAARAIPRSSGVAMLIAQGISPERAESIMGDVGKTHFTAPELDHERKMQELQTAHARLQASDRSRSALLRRVLEANRRGVLVTRPIGARADGAEVDTDLEAELAALDAAAP